MTHYGTSHLDFRLGLITEFHLILAAFSTSYTTSTRCRRVWNNRTDLKLLTEKESELPTFRQVSLCQLGFLVQWTSENGTFGLANQTKDSSVWDCSVSPNCPKTEQNRFQTSFKLVLNQFGTGFVQISNVRFRQPNKILLGCPNQTILQPN